MYLHLISSLYKVTLFLTACVRKPWRHFPEFNLLVFRIPYAVARRLYTDSSIFNLSIDLVFLGILISFNIPLRRRAVRFSAARFSAARCSENQLWSSQTHACVDYEVHMNWLSLHIDPHLWNAFLYLNVLNNISTSDKVSYDLSSTAHASFSILLYASSKIRFLAEGTTYSFRLKTSYEHRSVRL